MHPVSAPGTHTWIGSFAARLIQLRPRTSIGSAVGCAVACYHHAAAIPPQRAVDIFLCTSTPPSMAPASAPRGPRPSRVHVSVDRWRRAFGAFA